MKKTILLGSTLLAMLVLGACKKDEVTPTNAAVQLYPTPVVTIGLDVQVISSSTPSARVAGLNGATVVVKQNGNTYSATTDASGVATFSGLTEGSYTYYVTQAGYAKVNGKGSLYYDGTPNVSGTSGNSTGSGSVTVNNNQTYSNSTTITLPRLGSSVSGVIMGDTDGSNPGGSAVLNSGTIVLTLGNEFEPNVYKTTLTNGIFTFTGLPESVDYTLSTEGINAIQPANGTITPSYLQNLLFPGNRDNGTTPLVGQTENRGITTLQ